MALRLLQILIAGIIVCGLTIAFQPYDSEGRYRPMRAIAAFLLGVCIAFPINFMLSAILPH